MSDENMFDSAIESLFKETLNRNKSEWMEAYMQGRPVLINGDGSISVIKDYKLPPKKEV